MQPYHIRFKLWPIKRPQVLFFAILDRYESSNKALGYTKAKFFCIFIRGKIQSERICSVFAINPLWKVIEPFRPHTFIDSIFDIILVFC